MGPSPATRKTPTCLQAAIALPAPSPLKRGVARSRVAAAIVVVLGPPRASTGYQEPARATEEGHLRPQVTSGGSEGWSGFL